MKGIKTGFFIILTLSYLSSFGGDPKRDSLLAVLHATHLKDVRMEILHELSKACAHTDFVQAKTFIHQAISIGKELNHKDLGKLYVQLGSLYFEYNEPDSLDRLLPSLFNNNIIHNQEIKIHARLLKGKFHGMTGENTKALTEFHLVRQLIPSNEFDKENFTATVNIATIHQNASNFKEALNYYHLAQPIAEKIGSELGIGYCHYGKGLIGMEQGRFEEALQEFILAEKYFTHQAGGKTYLYHLYYKIASSLQELNQPDKAIPYLHQSIKFAKQVNNVSTRAHCYLIIAEHLFKQHEDTYKVYLDSAQELSKTSHLISINANIHYFKYQIATAQNKTNDALMHYQMYVTLKDSIASMQEKKETLQAELGLALSKVDQLILSLKNTDYKFYLGGSVLGVLISILVFMGIKIKNKTSSKGKSNDLKGAPQLNQPANYSLTEITLEKNHESDFMNQLNAVIETQYHNYNFGIDDLSNALGLSRSQLHRKVKACSKFTPLDLIRNYRLQKAQVMLLQESAQISSVALSVGFKNFSYFTKTFKEYIGVTPSEFILAKSRETYS